ncbi:MAG: WecB/TagA/CpsF family glycosyl transferase N-acetylglucosaminyldiphosphoundecaprenol [Candidatus Peribacteria bacterium]|nr:WecB/TagA/CpsF family glycosyl transferase N-acetylglucosaminyldiphosphoundecaprenol [Candidatus Peribacteria bacterium]
MTEESLAPLPRVSLLGVPVDAVTQEEAIARMRGYLSGTAQYHVVTPNSEMLVEAARNPAFHAVLQKTSLNLPDSHGLLWMAFLTGQKLKERVTGVDTVTAFCSQLTADDSVFFLGAAPGVAEKAAAFLQ